MFDTPLEEYYALSVVNAVACAMIFCICVCRVILSDKQVILRVRLKFIFLGPCALMFGISPIWSSWPGWAAVIFSVAVASGLLAESFQWKKGPPASVKKDTMPAELREEL